MASYYNQSQQIAVPQKELLSGESVGTLLVNSVA